jgi:hypothetical protein
MHCIHGLKLGGSWLCHLLCLTLDMRVLCMLVQMLHRLLEPVSLRRLDHVSHLETSVMGASLTEYARFQLLSFLYKVLHVACPASVLFVFAISFGFLRAYEEFGSPGGWSVTLMLRTELFVCFYARVLFLWHPPRCWML